MRRSLTLGLMTGEEAGRQGKEFFRTVANQCMPQGDFAIYLPHRQSLPP
ncbi:MAG: hypothetical protein ACKN9U_07270 [Pirellulaceae bacterium]